MFVCVWPYLLVCLWACVYVTDLMIWRATQADRDGICCMRGGLHCFCQLRCCKNAHTCTNTRIPHKMPQIQTHAHTHTVCKLHCLWLFKATPGLFLSICGDRMTILPPTTWAEPCQTTPAQEHHTRSATEICCFSTEKQHEPCLSNWQQSSQQNKQALLRQTQWHICLAEPMPLCVINAAMHGVKF